MSQTTRDTTRRRAVDAVADAGRVLRLFTVQTPECGAADLSEQLSISVSRARAIADALVGQGLLECSTDGSAYRVGLLAFELGKLVERRDDFYHRVRTALEALRDKVGHSVQFGILDRGDLLIIATIDGNEELVVISIEGDRVPAYASAGGRAILSALPYDLALTLLPLEPRAITPSTATDRTVLMGLIRGSASLGYAYQEGELLQQVAAVGVPVYDALGVVVGGLSVSYPSASGGEGTASELAGRLIDTAEVLGKSVGGVLAGIGDNPLFRGGDISQEKSETGV